MILNKYNYDISTCKIIECNKCDISLHRKHIVNGIGRLDSRIMFIGESPGYVEDKEGIPFVGHSGQLLNIMLDAIGLTREDVYITNVTKCKPNNNDTLAVHIRNCHPNLDKELLVINPKIVILLGSIALNRYFNKTGLTIGKFRGKTIPHEDRFVLCTYHPSYVLRNIETESLRTTYLNDFFNISQLYRKYINKFITVKI